MSGEGLPSPRVLETRFYATFGFGLYGKDPVAKTFGEFRLAHAWPVKDGDLFFLEPAEWGAGLDSVVLQHHVELTRGFQFVELADVAIHLESLDGWREEVDSHLREFRAAGWSFGEVVTSAPAPDVGRRRPQSGSEGTSSPSGAP